MSDIQAAVNGIIDACVKFSFTLSEWFSENRDIIVRMLLTNNSRKRYGLPLKRKQAIKRAKKNRRKRV